MGYSSMRACANDLEKHGQLVRINMEVDPDLEMAEIHRRVYEAGGPALLFEQVKGSPFQAISNVYGTFERTEFIFRDTLAKVAKVVELKIDPTRAFKKPGRYFGAPFTALKALPMRSRFGAPVKYGTTTIDQLPLVKSWPMDGGAFVTLPQVYTEDPDKPGAMNSNLGMYRIQVTGNDYKTNEEIGLHYQLHRGIGVHHTKYNQNGQPFRASVFVGGPPSHAFCAIMPLPEGLSELTFAGMLGGRRFRLAKDRGHVLSSDADFVITGIIEKDRKMPEGPFGDHLGYYSLQHDFPVMKVDRVYYRKDALWHFTVVGRPPQEDSSFGYLIHKIVEPLTPEEFPGLVEINAVDAAGVHPLLIAIGQERYMPFREKRPEEILTIANHLLGKGQTTLAKFLIIGAEDKERPYNTHDISDFFHYILERIDWKRDLHFQTKTTMDTLDYSGTGWNAGSKVVMACCGPKLRELSTTVPGDLKLPAGFDDPKVVMPGILAIKAPKVADMPTAYKQAESLTKVLEMQSGLEGFPMILLVDDPVFVGETLNNFLWVTFTRANPSHDLHGVGAFVEHKHWGCKGP
ncbi:MAG: UbiD family decarboxylase, partial [Bacteroidota bacterium]